MVYFIDAIEKDESAPRIQNIYHPVGGSRWEMLRQESWKFVGSWETSVRAIA